MVKHNTHFFQNSFMPVPYICIARIQSNDKSNDYIRYPYPENVIALPSPLLIKKYNVITVRYTKKKGTVTVTALQVTRYFPTLIKSNEM